MTGTLAELATSMRQLERLSGEDGAMRPVLLRVACDLFIGRLHHRPADLKQFEEMVVGLIEVAEETVVHSIAGRLARHAQTPQRVLLALVARGGSGAIAVLEAAPAIDRAVLLATAERGAPQYAAAVARRTDLDEEICARLIARHEVSTIAALVRNATARLPLAALHACAPLAHGEAAADLARRLAALAPPAAPADHKLHRRLELLAMTRQTALLFPALAEALAMEPARVRLLFEDPAGEALALMLAALAMPGPVAARILMSSPAAQSTRGINALVRLVDTCPPDEARTRLAAIGGPARGAKQLLPLYEADKRAAPRGSEPARSTGGSSLAAPRRAMR